jgi:hypothetical protein
MALDIWIHGAGYGESIVLAWDEAGGLQGTRRRHAVIDSYQRNRSGVPSMETFALRVLKANGADRLAFAVGTHPHFDHLATLPEVLAHFGSSVERVFWWGGHHRSVVGAYFDAFYEHSIRTGQGDRSRAVRAQREFIAWVCELAGDGCPDRRTGRKEASFIGVQHAYSAALPGNEGRIEVWAISPHLGPQKKFREEMESCIAPNGKASKMPNSEGNDTSLAFLIQYGQRQIVLGGDASSENWALFKAEWDIMRSLEPTLPALKPDVIKVCHHGSEGNAPEEMWKDGLGFYESGGNPVAVVTPWSRLPNSRMPVLPDESEPDKSVLKRISKAGCHLIVTGGSPKESNQRYSLLNRSNRDYDSHVHLVIPAVAGQVYWETQSCREFDPGKYPDEKTTSAVPSGGFKATGTADSPR